MMGENVTMTFKVTDPGHSDFDVHRHKISYQECILTMTFKVRGQCHWFKCIKITKYCHRELISTCLLHPHIHPCQIKCINDFQIHCIYYSLAALPVIYQEFYLPLKFYEILITQISHCSEVT